MLPESPETSTTKANDPPSTAMRDSSMLHPESVTWLEKRSTKPTLSSPEAVMTRKAGLGVMLVSCG